MHYDAVVAGAGPAGAMAAYALAAAGVRTVIVEKKTLPRYKACSGILIPRSVDILTREFGDIPESVRSQPFDMKTMRMHFRSGRHLDVPLQSFSIKRHLFDQWLCSLSGAEVMDGTTLVRFSEKEQEVQLVCRRRQEIKIYCRVLIAADGGYSTVAARLDPERYGSLTWYVALQEVYDCRSDLEEGIFHFFAIPDISLYSSAYRKDSQLVTEVVARSGKTIHEDMARFLGFLKESLRIRDPICIRRTGCRVTYAAAQESFCFGTPRILIAGEASGLLNQFGEGISSALASGLVAGRAALNGIMGGFAPGDLYRREIEAEKTYTGRQFKASTLLSGTVPTFRWNNGLSSLAWTERILLVTDLIRWYLRLRAGDRT